MMIDTHCHLDKEEYDNLDEIINHMGKNIIIASGCDLKTNKNVIDLVNKYDNIYGTIGFHPEEIDNYNDESLTFLEDNLSNPKIVGIGEIGLDYHYSHDNKDQQIKAFIEQIELAKRFNKTIVIHSREAIEDTYNVLEKYLNNNKAILHCYSGSLEMARRFKKLGLKFGIGGVVTFKNSQKLQDVVEELDITDLVLETDSPYLCPEPFRGKKNEPYNIAYVAQKIAEIKNIDYDKVLEITTKTAISQFDLM